MLLSVTRRWKGYRNKTAQKVNSGEREREADRQTDRGRQTDRQTEGEKERQTDRDRQTEGGKETDRQRHTEREGGREGDRQTEKISLRSWRHWGSNPRPSSNTSSALRLSYVHSTSYCTYNQTH